MQMNYRALSLATGLALALTAPAFADNTYQIAAEKGSFSPVTIEVPANQKITLNVKNNDTEQVEFESYPLNIEQKINAGDSQQFFVGPLKPGSYAYFDDNNPDAKGTVVAR